MIGMDTVLLAWATGMLVLLYRTNSFKTSIATTIVVVGFFISSLLHSIFGNTCDMFMMAAVLSVLVFRVIPHDTVDKWSKKKCC